MYEHLFADFLVACYVFMQMEGSTVQGFLKYL